MRDRLGQDPKGGSVWDMRANQPCALLREHRMFKTRKEGRWVGRKPGIAGIYPGEDEEGSCDEAKAWNTEKRSAGTKIGVPAVGRCNYGTLATPKKLQSSRGKPLGAAQGRAVG